VGAALDVGHGSQELVVAEDQVSFQEAPPERRLKTGGSSEEPTWMNPYKHLEKWIHGTGQVEKKNIVESVESVEYIF
jgi:hypothetical protein